MALESPTAVRVLGTDKATEVGQVTWLNPSAPADQPPMFLLVEPASTAAQHAGQQMKGREALHALGVDKRHWMKRFYLLHSLQLPCGEIFPAGARVRHVHKHKQSAAASGSPAAADIQAETPATPGSSMQQVAAAQPVMDSASPTATPASCTATTTRPENSNVKPSKKRSKTSVIPHKQHSPPNAPLTPNDEVEAPRSAEQSSPSNADSAGGPSIATDGTPAAATLHIPDVAGLSRAADSSQAIVVERATSMEVVDADRGNAGQGSPAAKAIAEQLLPAALPVYLTTGWARRTVGHAQWLGGQAALVDDAVHGVQRRRDKFMLCDPQYRPVPGAAVISGTELLSKALQAAGLPPPKQLASWQGSVCIAVAHHSTELDHTFPTGTPLGTLLKCIKNKTAQLDGSALAKRAAEQRLDRLRQEVAKAGLTWQEGMWRATAKATANGCWQIAYHCDALYKRNIRTRAAVLKCMKEHQQGHAEAAPQAQPAAADNQDGGHQHGTDAAGTPSGADLAAASVSADAEPKRQQQADNEQEAGIAAAAAKPAPSQQQVAASAQQDQSVKKAHKKKREKKREKHERSGDEEPTAEPSNPSRRSSKKRSRDSDNKEQQDEQTEMETTEQQQGTEAGGMTGGSSENHKRTKKKNKKQRLADSPAQSSGSSSLLQASAEQAALLVPARREESNMMVVGGNATEPAEAVTVMEAATGTDTASEHTDAGAGDDDEAMTARTAADDMALVVIDNPAATEVVVLDDDDDEPVEVARNGPAAAAELGPAWPIADESDAHMVEPPADGMLVVPAAGPQAVAPFLGEHGQWVPADLMARDVAPAHVPNHHTRPPLPSLVFRGAHSHKLMSASEYEARRALNQALVEFGFGHLCERASAAWMAQGGKVFIRAYVDLDAAWQTNNVQWFRRVLREYFALVP